MEKIEETFKHINDNWKEEYYQTCKLDWENIISFISKEPTPYQCSNCNTFWMKYGFLETMKTNNICPNCDTHCQPFLCNPINYIYVLQYINPKYHQQENIDAIKDLALNDINIFKMIDPETNKPTKELQAILKSLGTDDLGEASWELQKIRGSIARDLGFKAVTMSDEQGLSYFLTPGTKLKAGKGE